MIGNLSAYLMAFSAMLFAATSALCLIHFVGHLDPPADVAAPSSAETQAAA
jgi:hypothetical protein